MSVWTELRERARGLLLSGRADRELAEEVRHHVELDVAARVRAGATDEEARRAALRAFGGVDRFREEARDARGVRALDDLVSDVRFAVRTLRRNPAFTVAAVAVLGLGIGANTAIFSAVDAVVLQSLPFPGADRLYLLWEENPEKNWHMETAAPANVLDWRERVAAFADIAAYASFDEEVVVSGDGPPRFLRGMLVTGNFFSVLGVGAAHGRTFRAEETWQGGERIVVLSARVWRDSYGSDPSVVGRAITLDGEPVRVVGIMPEGFAFPSARTDVWLPMQWPVANRAQSSFRRAHWLRPIARLAPGASAEGAAAQLDAVAAQLEAEYPATNRLMGAGMTPLQEYVTGDTRTPLLVMLGAVGLLLLIACANVGNLLLVKASGRRREMAVRSAIGAGRFRLVRQLITESLVLSLLGGVAGVALGVAGTRGLVRLQPEGLLNATQFGLSPRVLGYILLITIASGLLFGAVPALWTRATREADALREAGRSGSAGRRARRATGAIVVAEVAVALLLVTGAALLARSFQELRRVDPGFDADGVLAVTLRLTGAKYESGDAVQAFVTQLEERARALPGVRSAAMTSSVPLVTRGYTTDFTVAGRAPDAYGTEIVHRSVTPGYLRTMRVPLVAGRDFTPADRLGADFVVIINEEVARGHFPGQDPIGQRIAFTRTPDSTTTWYTIVGVAGGERQQRIAAAPQMEALHPFDQERRAGMTLMLRTDRDPFVPLPAVRAEVAALDPGLPIYEARAMDAVLADSLARERFFMVLLTLFAATALALAIVGVYGVTAQLVRQRTTEIGVRLALGAAPRDVLRLVVGRTTALVAAGVVLGVLTARVATRALAGMLFGIAPTDAPTFAAVALTLIGTGVLTAWLPARRASLTQPVSALRPEGS